ncbi:glycosylase [candidate division KSB1 bacterium]|nr:glycosylase [candidate division KSB1 bacterium]
MVKIFLLCLYTLFLNCTVQNQNGETDMQTKIQEIYQEIQTPHKYGIVLKHRNGHKLDCPSIFRYADKWYMTYIIFDGNGYQTALAESEDLLYWHEKGVILGFKNSTWDASQVGGYIALQDYRWEGSYKLLEYKNRYWMSYLGGALKGYETDPLSIGIAWTHTPHLPEEWHRLECNPVLTPDQPDARPFERATLYKSHIIYDKDRNLGYPFVMFYNARQKGNWIERIGIAVSEDMIKWERFGENAVIDNASGISGDPQITKIEDTWVMFYFGYKWKPQAFDTFAISNDLIHWTKWQGDHLIAPSEPWDETFAHKPFIVKHRGIVYHFYCAVGKEGRVIALATSKKLK